MLRVKFLRMAGGAAVVAAGTLAHVEETKGAALGETITVPPQPLHGVVVAAVQVNPTKNLRQVELFVDGDSLGVDAVSPYTFVWDTTKVSNGSHQLRADATYRGSRRHSGVATVMVDNSSSAPPPPIGGLFPILTLYPAETLAPK